jgi:hypothetical protein
VRGMVEASLLYDETSRISEKKTVGDPWDAEHTQVRVEQSRDFYNKADSDGLDIEHLELDGGTHYFDDHDSRLAMFQALEKFLAAHLQGICR